MSNQEFTIRVDHFGGFTPKYFKSIYPSFGNKNSAGGMQNIDLTNPSAMTQGKGIVALTAGTQAGAITTLLRGVGRTAVTATTAYAVGGALLQQFSSTAVTDAGIWPHTITGTGAITGEDIVHYKGKLLYSYNDAGAAGDMGSYDLSSTFDDSYFVGTLSGTALQNAPHQMIAGGNSRVYIANGQYVAVLDGTGSPWTATDDALDFIDDNCEVASISWNYDRVIIAVNKPNITTVANQSAVYRWTGYDDSWEGDPIEVNGKIGALFTKNGITYIWYQSFEGAAKRMTFGYLSGGMIVPLEEFDGTLPAYYQVSERNDYLIWMSSGRLFMYGSLTSGTPKLFQYLSTTYGIIGGTIGGIGCPFGKILVSSTHSTNYEFASESGYSVDSFYKTMLFSLSSGASVAQLDRITVFTDVMLSDAKLKTLLRYDMGKSNKWLDEIEFTAATPTRHIIGKSDLPKVENARLEFYFEDGDTSHPVNITGFTIEGHWIKSL